MGENMDGVKGRIVGRNQEETHLLNEMRDEAGRFVRGFSWSPSIFGVEFFYGVAGIIAIFLFRFEEKIGGTDDKLWVVVGDLPSAYLVVEPRDNPREAVERYCGMMEEWCDAVTGDLDLSNVYPVQAEPTEFNADLLRKRIGFIRKELIDGIPDAIVD